MDRSNSRTAHARRIETLQSLQTAVASSRLRAGLTVFGGSRPEASHDPATGPPRSSSASRSRPQAVSTAASPAAACRHTSSSIEIGRRADPSLPADVGDGYPISALPENERLLRVRKLRCFHRLPLLPANGKIARKTVTLNGPLFREQITPTRTRAASR